jgi:hypothetical protein
MRKTESQEKSSLIIFKEVLNNNKEYKSWEDIQKDKKLYEQIQKEFKKSGSEVDVSWLKSFYGQQKEILRKYRSNTFKEFKYKDDPESFHKYIIDTYKKYKLKKYENWNPADIWIVSGDQKKIEKQINDAIKYSIPSKNVERLNSILRHLFKTKQVIGISLKKTGISAKFIEVNVDKGDYLETKKKEDKFQLKQIKLDLTMNIGSKLGKYNTQDLKIFLSDNVSFQIKANNTSKFDNLKFESSLKGSGGRGGKSEVKEVINLLKMYSGKKFINNYNKYPKSVDEFKKLSSLKKYLKIFKFISNHVNIGLSVNEKELFIQMFENGFKYDPYTATSKLMQMEFIYLVLQIPNKKTDDFWTDMIWLSQKKGIGFGPHGKLY